MVKAFVVLVDNFTGDREALIKQIQEHVKDTTAPYKYPRKVNNFIGFKIIGKKNCSVERVGGLITMWGGILADSQSYALALHL